jgi:chromosome segregation ATPase
MEMYNHPDDLPQEMMQHVAAAQYSFLEQQMVVQSHQTQLSQLQMAEMQNQDLRNRVASLQAEAKIAQQEADRAEEELGKQVAVLRKKLQEHRSESDKVSKECADLIDHVNANREKTAALKAENADLRQKREEEVKRREDRAAQRAAEMAQAAAKHEEAQAEKQRRCAQLKEDSATLTARVRAIQEEQGCLNAEAHKAENGATSLGETKEVLVRQVADVSKALRAEEAALERIQRKNTDNRAKKMDKKVNELRQRIETRENNCEELELRLVSVHEQMSMVLNDSAALVAKNRTKLFRFAAIVIAQLFVLLALTLYR